jgi:WD40 repeat protein
LQGGNRVVSPDGHYVLLKGESNTVWIVDTLSGSRLAALPHTYEVAYCCFSGDGRTVLTAAEKQGWVADTGNDIFLWDTRTGRRLNSSSMSQAFRLMYVAFSPDNRRLLTCGFDFSARLWDVQTGQPLSGLMRHGQPVVWGAFSPDGSSVVTVSRDKTARVWDAATGVPLTPPLRHKSALSGAFWSADLKKLETVTVDDYLQIWDLASGLPLTPPRKIWDIGDEPTPSLSSGISHQDEDLPRDDRPVADLVLLSQMLAVGRIDAAGNAVPLMLPELTKGWQVLREKYPEQFAATPSEVVAWHRQEAEESEKEGNLTAALFHLDRAVAAQPAEPLLTRWRGNVAAALAHGTNHAPLSVIPFPRFAPRDPRASAKQIDLSRHYNLELHRPGGSDFGDLGEGLLTLGGVQFDVRGGVHLNGQTAKQEGSTLPARVDGIRVGQKCLRLHFLQATGWNAETGVAIGSYVLHYADGQRLELPIVFGRDTDNWWIDGLPSANLLGGALPVWNGTNPQAAENGCSLLLYKNTRENPRPDVEVTSIDFVSNMTIAAPFLVALTVE